MTKRLAAKTGTYLKDNETKNKYTNLGVILSNDNGEYMLLDATVSLAGVLAAQNAMSDRPRTSIMVSIFDDSRQQQSAPSQPQGQPAQDAFDDSGDLPF